MIYYVDENLKFENKNYKELSLNSGDSVLFKKGSFYRDRLETVEGVTYGAWGEGENPVFCGSTDLSSPLDWEEVSENIWKCTREIDGDVGNFVFNKDECSATFCWEKSELSCQGAFFDSRASEGERRQRQYSEQLLLMYSEKNPALFYSHIECVSYKERTLGTLVSDIVIENITFKNSSVHALAGEGCNITIRSCTFENIGGSGWDKNLRVRFGNAIEIWYAGRTVENILIENCTFKNIYDSCATYQGSKNKTEPCRNFICRNNIFDTYSMAAFEYRDSVPIDSIFENNICRFAGCGFGMLGDTLPRNSVIYPEPMGHHIFIWRMEKATEEGRLIIRNNTFCAAPVGAAIFSIASKQAEAQIHLENNLYTKNDTLLVRFGGKDFSSLEEYQKETGKDAGSKYTVSQ